MNIQLEVLYKRCCKQPLSFLKKAADRKTSPHKNCPFYEAEECRSDYFCRQLVKTPVVGSWFANLLHLKKWLRPGEAVYVRKNDTGGLTVTTDPFPFIGNFYPKRKDGLILISKRDRFCSCCRGKEVTGKSNLCKKCQPLYGIPEDDLEETG